MGGEHIDVVPVSAPAVDGPAASAATEQARSGEDVVVIRLVGGRYAVAMSAVVEVGRLPQVTRVPGLPTWLVGVANWRGRVLAVVDVRGLLGSALTPVSSSGRLLVLRRDGLVLGLVTEGVEAVSEALDETVEPALVTLPPAAAALLSGQLTDAAGPLGILDLAAVFALADTLPRARRAG
ncbi:MAG: chemotaxis protein CheW [Actinomycetota bacterium]|nr:chemotaxis protein CheW [Actinomycetota bacterium]